METLNDEYVLDENEIQQSVMEISNILGSSCIGKLAALLGADVTFTPPTIEVTQQAMPGPSRSQYSHIIVISTVLEFKELQILGKMFIMFNNAMFTWLEKALEEYLENI